VLVVPVLGMAVADWAPGISNAEARLATLAPLGWITVMSVALLVALVLGAALLRWRSRGAATGPTWGCGYIAPTARMQYSASSFAQMLVGLLHWVLRPRVHKPGGLRLFPSAASFHSAVPDPVLDEAVLPTVRLSSRVLTTFRAFQQGSIQSYLLYIFLALMALLLWR